MCKCIENTHTQHTGYVQLNATSDCFAALAWQSHMQLTCWILVFFFSSPCAFTDE